VAAGLGGGRCLRWRPAATGPPPQAPWSASPAAPPRGGSPPAARSSTPPATPPPPPERGGGEGSARGGRRTAAGAAAPHPHAGGIAGTYTESMLYSLTGGSNGASPFGGLIFDAAGNLYGTTVQGGGNGCGGNGCGTVFRLTLPQ